jgi:uncharacterized membrane protein YjfL (UPF0719 family)
MNMDIVLPQVYSVVSLLVLFVVVFTVAKLANELLTPYNIDDELTENDNFALAVSLSGYMFSVVIIFVGAMIGPSKGVVNDLLNVGGYSLLGIVLLNISRIINDKIILRKFSNVKEILEDRNAGVGVVQMGSYIASALIIAGAISGEGGGFVTASAFFFLGQLALLIMAGIYNLITSYDLHEELEKDNVSAGIGFAGSLIAIGVILLSSLSGNFVSWGENLKTFAIDGAIAFVVLPLFRLYFDKVIIPKSDLNHEIKNDQNCGAGLLEFVITVGFSIILFLVLKD